jgi:hypothetical protein
MRDTPIWLVIPALLACSQQGAVPQAHQQPQATIGDGAPPTPAPQADPTATDGGPADAGSPNALCSSLASLRADDLALIGRVGSELVLVDGAGTIRRAPGPGESMSYTRRAGWVAAYDTGHPGTWHV